MRKLYRGLILFTILAFVVFAAITGYADKSDPDVDIIIKKNIEAAGGLDTIKSLKNISFEMATPPPYGYTQSVYHVASPNLLKLESGAIPAVDEVFVYDGTEFKENHYYVTPELAEERKVELKCFTKLISGAFTMMNFKDNLKFKETKKYGPEIHHVLTAKMGDCNVNFHIGADDFLLKRVIFDLSDKEKGLYQKTYDLAGFEEVDGLKLPMMMYTCDIGAGASARGSEISIRNLKINQDLPKNFFRDTKLNYGSVTTEKGHLEGNLILTLWIGSREYRHITTNFKEEDIKKSELKSNDKIKLEVGDKSYDALFLSSASEMNEELRKSGNVVFAKHSRAPVYIILMHGQKFESVENLETLTKIKIDKIEKQK